MNFLLASIFDLSQRATGHTCARQHLQRPGTSPTSIFSVGTAVEHGAARRCRAGLLGAARGHGAIRRKTGLSLCLTVSLPARVYTPTISTLIPWVRVVEWLYGRVSVFWLSRLHLFPTKSPYPLLLFNFVMISRFHYSSKVPFCVCAREECRAGAGECW